MERKAYQLHEVIFREHEYQKCMYSICEGEVDIYSGFATPQEKKLTTLTKGQSFGEIGLVARMPRTATAVAAADNVVLELIGNEDFEEYLKNHPENLQPIMSSVSSRIRGLTEDLSMAAQLTNELLGTEKQEPGWLAGSVHKLLAKWKARNDFSNEFATTHRRKLVLTGELPPWIRFSAGDVIFRAGEEADCMYEICSGQVGIYSDYGTDHEKILATLKAEDVFGEMGILDDMPRSASAVCLTECNILVIKRENFMGFFQNKPVKILQNLQQMCIQLRNLTRIYLQVCESLEEISSMEKNSFREEEAIAKLEYIRQSQLATGVYEMSLSRDCWYDHL